MIFHVTYFIIEQPGWKMNGGRVGEANTRYFHVTDGDASIDQTKNSKVLLIYDALHQKFLQEDEAQKNELTVQRTTPI
jgi:hypothetical protein